MQIIAAYLQAAPGPARHAWVNLGDLSQVRFQPGALFMGLRIYQKLA